MDNKNSNKSLEEAKKNKNDEFYTQLTDIEKELNNYKKHFENKVVFCNCDDPEWSNFWNYFILNFDHIGLKKIISTHYKKNSVSYKLECEGKKDENGQFIFIKTALIGDGDFRSEECIELLKQSDIVCTNPPFSLFKEYLSQLVKYDKKFLIIGSVNAITYKETFKLIKENKLWLGHSIHSGDREFRVPDHYPLNASGTRVDNNGNKYIRVKGVRWFTNLDYKERHEDIVLFKKYNIKENPKYDNYDAIEVSKTNHIPMDYPGVMGVPITFLDKYNPDQFEIVGNEYDLNIPKGRVYINNVRQYSRIFIKLKGETNEN